MPGHVMAWHSWHMPKQDMSQHGMIQLFEEDGSGNLHALVAPMEIDMTTGDVTFTFESAISGVAVFYSFADDEGTVTV